MICAWYVAATVARPLWSSVIGAFPITQIQIQIEVEHSKEFSFLANCVSD
jgi:hypothetical protein